MRYYEMHLPMQNNAGTYNYAIERGIWETMALKHCGGFSRSTVEGAWIDDNGQTKIEAMVVYKIATDASDIDVLINAAFEVFPDQAAVFVARCGTAEIYSRSKAFNDQASKSFDVIG